MQALAEKAPPMPDPSSPDREIDRPEVDRLGLGLWAAVVLGLGTLLLSYRYLGVLAAGQKVPFWPVAVQEYVGALGGGLMFFPFRRFVRAYEPRLRRLPLYVLVVLALSVCHTTWNWLMRTAIYGLLGWGSYDYGRMPLRYFMELPIDVLALTFAAAGIHIWDSREAARAEALRASRLEARLARAQVHNLRLQMQPHFLFNGLDTISATLHRNPDAADEMIERLAALLRASLRTGDADRVPLGSELALLEGYLSIMRARFGDRLRVGLEVEPGLGSVAVPSLLLQPWVENAIRHGAAESEGQGQIDIRIAKTGPARDRLLLEVVDDGPGVAPGRDPLRAGLGLSTTAERLELLYGDRQRFEAGNHPDGGFGVRAELPIEPGTAERAPSSRALAEPLP